MNMDFDQLITLIIVLVLWGVSAVFQKVNRADPEKRPTAPRKSGFFETLRQKLAAMEEEARNREVRDLDAFLEPARESATGAHDAPAREASAEAEPRPVPLAADARVVPLRPAAAPAPPRPAAGSGNFPAATSPGNLRNAVVWAEILAVPVALRDDKQ
ncbi:MAG: hypothetical protein RQ753_00290 [Desulfurivibrionaceae bacterium]|nr:hypothetical protein [Desulfobulbales bacterium]MDT8334113.1 hypothetical protein [Desulfurivibrionaceae bacterium]